MATAVTDDDINAWMRKLYALAKIGTVTFRNGTVGLINVPGKYVAVIDAMHAAMSALANGDPLPEFAEPAPVKKKGKR